MKICLQDGEAVEVDARKLCRGGEFRFPCGCTMAIDAGRPAVLGVHPALLYAVDDVPLDCEATWDLIGSGHTKGVFQLESPMGRKWAKRLKPRTMEQLSALVALLRPGCLKAVDDRGVSMTELYCRRKNGEEEAACEFEAIRAILEPTFHVMCYQEQMMKIAQVVAGFDLVEVDDLRKAAGKKDQELMARVGEKFVAKAVALGILTEEEARRLFDNIRKSGRYLFNKSHSVAYALNTYRSAHWKAHFPLYFFTAYLYWAKEKKSGGGPLKEMKQLVNDAKHFGIAVLPPRFADLRSHFGTDGVRVTFGLADVRGVGDKAIDKMRAEIAGVEAALGSTRLEWSWYDFLTRFAHVCGAGVVRRMIEVGALRDYGDVRQRLLAEHDAWERLTASEREAILGLDRPVYRTRAVTRKETYVSEETGRKRTRDVLAGEARDLVDDARPVADLEAALAGLLARVTGHTKGTRAKPSVPKHAYTAARRPKIESILDLLRRPASPHVDTSHWVAQVEEANLGVPLTASHVSSADRTIVNATVRDYLAGSPPPRDGLYILGVEVQDVVERVVQTGDLKGRKMGRLTVADETATLEDVVAFPEAWALHGFMLHRPNTVVAIGGKRSFKDGSTFIVEQVWEI